MTYIIQRVFLIHDWLYANTTLIPAESLDGKDQPTKYYIIVSEPITELPAGAIYLHRTSTEAHEALEEMEEDEL